MYWTVRFNQKSQASTSQCSRHPKFCSFKSSTFDFRLYWLFNWDDSCLSAHSRQIDCKPPLSSRFCRRSTTATVPDILCGLLGPIRFQAKIRSPNALRFWLDHRQIETRATLNLSTFSHTESCEDEKSNLTVFIRTYNKSYLGLKLQWMYHLLSLRTSFLWFTFGSQESMSQSWAEALVTC